MLLLHSLLDLLLFQFVLKVVTVWHQALLFGAVLGVIATQSDQLSADRAGLRLVRRLLLLARLSVRNHTLHTLTTLTPTVRISTLTGVHQALYATLNGETPVFGR